MNNTGSHNQTHGHTAVNTRNLLLVTCLNLIITLAELIGGILSNSLSLMSDALHNLGDAFASFIAWIASRLSSRSSTPRATFGMKRIEILAALLNAVVLAVLCIYLFREAWIRILEPEPVNSSVILIVATIGLFANLYGVILLKKDSSKSINVRAAYLHLLGDSLSSVAVIAGGLIMHYFEIFWVDPLITILIGIYILKETFSILKQTVTILMQNTPESIDLHDIKKDIELIPEVENIHHLHAWNLTDQLIHFEAHVEVNQDLQLSQVQKVQENIELLLRENFKIDHVTLQFEYKNCVQKSMIHNGN